LGVTILFLIVDGASNILRSFIATSIVLVFYFIIILGENTRGRLTPPPLFGEVPEAKVGG
jgi:hypothetical protein